MTTQLSVGALAGDLERGAVLALAQADDKQADRQCKNAADSRANEAAMRDFRPGNVVEREQKDDVRGEAHRKQRVVHVEHAVGEPGKHDDQERENDLVGMHMRQQNARKHGTGQGADRARDGPAGCVGDAGTHDQQGCHRDPVAAVEVELPVKGRADGEHDRKPARIRQHGAAHLAMLERQHGGEVGAPERRFLLAHVASQRQYMTADLPKPAQHQGRHQQLHNAAGEDQQGPDRSIMRRRGESRGDQQRDDALLAYPDVACAPLRHHAVAEAEQGGNQGQRPAFVAGRDADKCTERHADRDKHDRQQRRVFDVLFGAEAGRHRPARGD